jgi:hypothetical protein
MSLDRPSIVDWLDNLSQDDQRAVINALKLKTLCHLRLPLIIAIVPYLEPAFAAGLPSCPSLVPSVDSRCE